MDVKTELAKLAEEMAAHVERLRTLVESAPKAYMHFGALEADATRLRQTVQSLAQHAADM